MTVILYGTKRGGWLNDWINNTIINRFVQDIRLGGIEYAQAWNGPGYNDTPGYVITGVTNGNSDELIDGVHRRPLQKFIGGVWRTINVAMIEGNIMQLKNMLWVTQKFADDPQFKLTKLSGVIWLVLGGREELVRTTEKTLRLTH